MGRFIGIKLSSDAIPDESTIFSSRHLLEKHRLTETLFKEISADLDEQKMHMKRETIFDSILIAAPHPQKIKTNQVTRR